MVCVYYMCIYICIYMYIPELRLVRVVVVGRQGQAEVLRGLKGRVLLCLQHP